MLDETAFATAQSGNDFVICGNTLVSSNVTSFYSDYPCVIPEGVVCIADKAFVDVTIVGSLELPESLLYIGNLSFDGGHYNAYNCDRTLDVIDLKNVVSIGDYAFRYWYYLDEVDLSNVTYLGEGAFYWCNYLESVKMAENMEYIGDGVFSESGQKTDAGEVTVTNAPDFSNYVYCGSFIDTNIMNAGADGTDDGYYYCNSMLLKVATVDGNTYEDGIVVADGTRVIADGALMAFSSTAGVTALRIPETVEVIGDLCYYGTLTDVYYAGDKAGWNKIEKLNEGNFENLTVHCAKSSAVSLEDCTVKLSYSKTAYTGKAKKPTVTVTDSDGNKLTKGTDYTVIYSNNKNAGTATVTVTGQGNYCDTVEKTFTISKVTASNITAALSYKKTTYNGKQKTPTVNATDNNGNTLVADTDYTVTFGKSTRKSVGRYKVTVTFKGNYSGSKTFYFTIVPGATSTVVTTLSNETGGYDDVIVRWDYVTGASGYYLYYKKSGDDTWSKAIDCGKTRTYTKKDLTDGTRYNFKVVAYYKSSSGTKYTALKSVSSSIYTLQKVKNPVVKKVSSAKIKMTWTEINGETGYQIQRMTVKNNKYVVQKSYYNDKNDSNIIISPKKGTKYYYRVRAYKTEKINGKSVKVYGPWSIVKPYKLT